MSTWPRGHGAYAGDDRTVMMQNANYVPGFPVHRRLLALGCLERDSTVGGVQRVFVESMNSAVHVRDHDGTACYSFALDKEGCVTQLACVFGAALRGNIDDSSELICFAAVARSLGDSVGAPLGEPVGAPPIDGSVGVEMNGILTHATSVALWPTTATTTATELTAAQVAETNAAIYVKANAKNPETKSFARYAKYQSARSAKDYTALGGSRTDLRHALRKDIIVVGTPPLDLFGGLRVQQPRRSKDPTKKLGTNELYKRPVSFHMKTPTSSSSSTTTMATLRKCTAARPRRSSGRLQSRKGTSPLHHGRDAHPRHDKRQEANSQPTRQTGASSRARWNVISKDTQNYSRRVQFSVNAVQRIGGS